MASEGSKRQAAGGWHLLLLAALPWLLWAGCSETVAFVALDIKVQDRLPPLLCSDDPRRGHSVTVLAQCDAGSVERTFPASAGAVNLEEIPLGRCTLSIKVTNRHGRTVLSGKAELTVEEGEHDPLEIALLEEKCAGACDADGDGLAAEDEKGLGTDPDLRDSDGDGLFDGLEAVQCCTDPADASSKDCQLMIQDVSPPLGPAGEWVLISTTVALPSPKVTLGTLPLKPPLQDGRSIFGQVDGQAVLGTVEASAAGTSATASYRSLFAVLFGEPELVFDMDKRAGALVALMQEVTDLAYLNDSLLLLGLSGTIGSTRLPVLLVVDRRKKIYSRTLLPNHGAPVALSAVPGRVAALMRSGTMKATLMASKLDATGQVIASQEVALPFADVVDMTLEPSGDAALVLYTNRLSRVSLDTTPAAVVSALVPAVSLKAQKLLSARCTGLVYRESAGAKPGEGEAHMACKVAPACASGQTCPVWTELAVLKSARACMAQLASGGGSGCWRFQVSDATELLGPPVVDEKGGLVYVASNKGVLAAALTTSSSIPVGALSSFIPGKYQGKQAGSAPLVMADGYLFAADGPSVWRHEPAQAAGQKRQGKDFAVGTEKEEALSLAVSTDGSLLEVLRLRGGVLYSSLGVCLRRCAGCICDKK